jgi:hypothetical protein
MGKRAWSPDSEEAAEKLTLAELNQRIATAKWRLDSAGNSQARKLSFKKLCELEQIRETLHGVPAPVRKLSARQS